jgi:TatD DNase family protein
VIDSHTHLDSLDDAEAALAAARAVGVQGMVSIGCGADSIRATLEITTFGEIAELARDPLVVAIGETGFDQFHDTAGSLEQQRPAFDLQCALAGELGLPLIIHSRSAAAYTIAALEEQASELEVILHCYALTEPADVERVLAHERWVCSFAGNLTYGSAQPLRDACARIPLDRLMVETDAPYLAPKPMRGKRNQPAFVQHTLQVLADVHGLTFDEARAATVATAERVFAWTPAAAAKATA